MAFPEADSGKLGIEPICRELAISHGHTKNTPRACRSRQAFGPCQAYNEVRELIGRVHAASSGLYGIRDVWHQLRRRRQAG